MEMDESTYQAARILGDRNVAYYHSIARKVERYEIAGVSKETARNNLADDLREIVEEEYEWACENLNILMSELLEPYLPSELEIDYWAIADEFLKDYSPRAPQVAKSVKSQNAKRKPAVSKAAKPKAASGKMPAQSKAAPKKAGTARRR